MAWMLEVTPLHFSKQCAGKYDSSAERKEAIACVGDRMEIELEVIVADCMSRQYRMKNLGDRAFDLLCQDDSRVSTLVNIYHFGSNVIAKVNTS